MLDHYSTLEIGIHFLFFFPSFEFHPILSSASATSSISLHAFRCISGASKYMCVCVRIYVRRFETGGGPSMFCAQRNQDSLLLFLYVVLKV